MIARYRLLAERLRVELRALETTVTRAEQARTRSAQQPADVEFFVAAAALNLHGFYSGLEHLLELIAAEVDNSRPSGANWHRDLLMQMSLTVTGLRPAVLASQTLTALADYREFRHVVRNVYTFDLRADRVLELAGSLRATFILLQQDLLAFAEFLDGLSLADRDAG